MKELLAAFLLTQQPMPDDMYTFEAPFTLACTPSLMSMVRHLEKDYAEVPIMMSQVGTYTTLILFVNKEHTTSTFVVSKKNKEGEEACIIWGGQSPNGGAYSVNPNPIFPGEES